jgi:phosphoribosylanthranilate isomerase
MTWIKICGITNLQDAQAAVKAGADAVGFVFYPKSPRHVEATTVVAIAAELPAKIEKIGVFVDHPKEVQGLTGIQMHFTSEQKPFPGTTLKKYLALRAGQAFVNENVDAVLIDSGSAQQPGGTGKTFDWKEAEPEVRRLSKTRRVVIAGGLTPANVAEAIRILKPWGVDVSSGVEASPGKKDWQKIHDFIHAVRRASVS